MVFLLQFNFECQNGRSVDCIATHLVVHVLQKKNNNKTDEIL